MKHPTQMFPQQVDVPESIVPTMEDIASFNRHWRNWARRNGIHDWSFQSQIEHGVSLARARRARKEQLCTLG